MTAYDDWAAILDQLEIDITALQDGGVNVFNEVLVGRKSSPSTLPCCLIWPDTVPLTPITGVRTEHRFNFKLIAVVEIGESYKASMKDALDKLVLVDNMLTADRSYGNRAYKLEIISWSPDVFDPRVTERHQAALSVTFYKII